ncbi:MAG: PTS system fructose subfamily transporter subunit IIA [Lacrimispora sphenoides]
MPVNEGRKEENMIGIIISGHGTFATGISSAVELLTGHQDFIIPVDFREEHSEEQLKENLKAAFDRLQDCEQVLVLCDILGGSPFKNAVMLSIGDERIKVLYGTNLGMTVELAMRCMMGQIPEADTLADEIIEIGKTQIGKYKYEPVEASEDFEEGI